MRKRLLPIVLMFLTINAFSQKKGKNAPPPPPPTNPTIVIPMKAESWTFQEQKVEFLEYKSKPSMKILLGAGPVVLKDYDFTNGTIELDFEPLDQRFASMYFHWQDAKENECFYFRTARGGNANAVDAVQYSPHIGGVNLWDMLPHFQTNATFQRNQSNHIKMVVSGKQMRVYVNNETVPTLEVPQLEGNVTHGTFAFDGEAIISNIVIKPNEVESLIPLAGSDPTNYDPRYIRTWQVTQPTIIPKGIDFSYDLFPKPETQWEGIEAERRALVNLTRKFGQSTTRRIVWLKVKINSATAQKRKLDFGFSDEVWVSINGRFLYVDKNLYGQPIMKSPDGRCSIENTSFALPLNAGSNELIIGVANDFYGWGIIARLDSMEGISIEK